MRLLDVRGRLKNKAVSKYVINWDGESRSKLQFKVKQFLKPYWYSHVVYEEFPVYGTKMKVDILNATYKIAVEVNGQQHSKFTPFFHQNRTEAFVDSIQRDVSKRKWAELNNFKFVEIEYDEVDQLTAEWFEEKFDVTL